MNLPKSRGTVLLAMALGMNLALCLPGCSGNANEREFLDSAPPGEPSAISERKRRPAKGQDSQ